MRQRQVYPSDQVIHIWANQSQDSARNGSNVSFDRRLLYSYSTVIAQLEKDLDGYTWAFISQDNLTPTTAKHVSRAKQATRQYIRFYSRAFSKWSGYSRTISEMLLPEYEALKSDFEALAGKRARLPLLVDQYNTQKDLLYSCAKSFGVDIPQDLPTTDNLKDKLKHIEALNREESKQRREREKRREEQQRLEDLEAYNAWIDGTDHYFPSSYRTHNAQITIRNGEVVTSQGARAPLDHVIKALAFYDSRRVNVVFAEGKPFREYHTNGHKIHLGHFTLDSIDDQGNVKAGCHSFTAAEIARFRAQWGEVLK